MVLRFASLDGGRTLRLMVQNNVYSKLFKSPSVASVHSQVMRSERPSTVKNYSIIIFTDFKSVFIFCIFELAISLIIGLSVKSISVVVPLLPIALKHAW